LSSGLRGGREDRAQLQQPEGFVPDLVM
jgi:hypothetical protein